MAELDHSERAEVALRSTTLELLKAISTVRRQQPHEVLDDIVEQARAKLWPDAKPAPGKGGKGGRKPAQPALPPASEQAS